jgi:hypothetical protein
VTDQQYTNSTRPNRRDYTLAPGESITGIVRKLPAPGTYEGNRLWIDLGNDILSLAATGKRGHAVLANQLEARRVRHGDRITITYHGLRESASSGHMYRHYAVKHCDAGDHNRLESSPPMKGQLAFGDEG